MAATGDGPNTRSRGRGRGKLRDQARALLAESHDVLKASLPEEKQPAPHPARPKTPMLTRAEFEAIVAPLPKRTTAPVAIAYYPSHLEGESTTGKNTGLLVKEAAKEAASCWFPNTGGVDYGTSSDSDEDESSGNNDKQAVNEAAKEPTLKQAAEEPAHERFPNTGGVDYGTPSDSDEGDSTGEDSDNNSGSASEETDEDPEYEGQETDNDDDSEEDQGPVQEIQQLFQSVIPNSQDPAELFDMGTQDDTTPTPIVVGQSNPSTVSEPANTKKGKAKKCRELVDQGHVSKLVRDYWTHFAAFSKGRKTQVMQLIPAKVWIQVYKDYLLDYSKSTFKEDSLKDHLRDSLKDMKSGVNSSEDGQTSAPQCDNVMEKLTYCDSWRARNILKLREDVMNGIPRAMPSPCMTSTPPPPAVPLPSHSTSPTPEAVDLDPEISIVSPPAPAPSIPHRAADADNCPPPPKATKTQNLKRAGEDISEMLSEFKGWRGERRAQNEFKRQNATSKHDLNDQKVRESEQRVLEAIERRQYTERQNKMAEIALLREQLAIGLISDDTFKEKSRIVFGL